MVSNWAPPSPILPRGVDPFNTLNMMSSNSHTLRGHWGGREEREGTGVTGEEKNSRSCDRNRGGTRGEEQRARREESGEPKRDKRGRRWVQEERNRGNRRGQQGEEEGDRTRGIGGTEVGWRGGRGAIVIE